MSGEWGRMGKRQSAEENKDENIILLCCKRLWKWFLGDLTGIGTFLVGAAAVLALLNGGDLLKEIFKVQEQAKKIDEAVVKLTSVVELLSIQLKQRRADAVVDQTPELQKPDSTKEQIRDALIRVLPWRVNGKQPMIYLPPDRVDSTVEKLIKAKTSGEKKAIIQNSMEYKASGVLQTEQGFILTTEDGKPLELEDGNKKNGQ